MLIALAAGIALVTARIYAGRGAALFAVGLFLVIHGGLALIVGPLLGEVTQHFSLYLAEGLLVEAVAFAVAPRERAYLFGAVAGVLIGTVGFAAEFGWSHVWMPNPWPGVLVGEPLPVVPLAGIAGGLIGGFVGTPLVAPRLSEIRFPSPALAAVGLAAIVAIFAYGLNTTLEGGVRATVQLTDVKGSPHREVSANVRVTPASAVHDSDWVEVLAWQGRYAGRLLDHAELQVGHPGGVDHSLPLELDSVTPQAVEQPHAAAKQCRYEVTLDLIEHPRPQALLHHARAACHRDVPPPVAAVARSRALSIPSPTKVKLVPPLVRVSRASCERTNTGKWKGGLSPHPPALSNMRRPNRPPRLS